MSNKLTNEDFLQKLEEQGRFDIQPLEEYINSHTKIKFKCLNNDEHQNFYMKPNNVISGQGCPICGREKLAKTFQRTQEEFEEQLKNLRPNLTLISEYKNGHSPVTLKCDKGHIWELKDAESILRRNIKAENSGCPYCEGLFLTEENSLGKTRPDLIKYLKNEKDAYNYSSGSGQKIKLICPDCGFEKEMTIKDLSSRGFFCNNCGDNISYPNKILREFFKILKQDNLIDYYKTEWKPMWSNKNYVYDGYFIKDNVKVVVEMQGEQHYYGWEKDKEDLKYQIKRDSEKRELAKNNGFIEIEIDCRDTSFNKIKENIINSYFSELINLSNFDWNKLSIVSEKSYVKVSAELYILGKTNKEISEILGINRNTVTRYLKRCKEIGLI